MVQYSLILGHQRSHFPLAWEGVSERMDKRLVSRFSVVLDHRAALISHLPDIVDTDEEELVVLIQSIEQLHEVLGLPFELVFAALRHDEG